MVIKAGRLCNRKIAIARNANEFDSTAKKRNRDYVILLDEGGCPNRLYSYYYKNRIYVEAEGQFAIVSEEDEIDIEKTFGTWLIVMDMDSKIVGVIGAKEQIKFLLEQMNSIKKRLDQVETDLDAFMSCTDDLVCISDGSGSKVRISSSCEKIYGIKSEDLIGKNVRDLEKSGIYAPSATRLVIEEKQQVSITQKTKTGRTLLVTAIPVFDEQGKIKRVVSISKDITDANKLKSELKQTKQLLQRYESELAAHRIEAMKDSEVIHRSKNMEQLLEMLKKVANVDTTILINGETGVGKEVIAKYIHNISNRNKGPFIKVNCGAIPENLIEAELFGYEKGAFTGARSEGKPGLIEVANGGTLFLDEIAEIPQSLQVKLLRVLQEKEFIKVGGVKNIKVDVRIIAATNKDLKQMVKNGEFREDLYYRLNVVPVTIPPLRERPVDIPILAHHFLVKYNEKYGYAKQLTKEVIECFMKYPWPGNVRELENIIERLIVTSEGNQITINDLPSELCNRREEHSSGGVFVSKLMPLKEATALVEYQLIEKALEEGGNTYRAAEILDVDQSTIVRKLKKYKSFNNR